MGKQLRWFLGSVLLLLAPLALQAAETLSDTKRAESLIVVPNPGIGLWDDVRHAQPGLSQIRGVETGVLINSTGEDWRNFRMQQLVPYGGYILGGLLSLIAVFYLLRGTIKIEGGRSDEVLFRFSVLQRITHWFMAGLFLLLGLTGLVLLFGRFVMLPLFGPEAFSVAAVASKEVHNLFGPLFPLSILMLLVLFGAQNIYEKGDLKWLLRGGGFFGGEHASAGRFNMGEKIFFWLTIGLGLAISVSGLVLNFPIFGQGRELMSLAHVVHGIVAVLFVGVAFGHIYMATIGTEGTLDAMTSGYVDRNWAKMHHDRWADETPPSQPPATSAPARAQTATAGAGD